MIESGTIHTIYTFDTIYNLTIGHEYYRHNVCRDLEVVPTQETTRRLAALRLQFKRSVSGFALVGNRESLQRHREYSSQHSLSFRLIATNPDFGYFTAGLDPEPAKKEPVDDEPDDKEPVVRRSVIQFTNIGAGGDVLSQLQRLPTDPNAPLRARPEPALAVVEIRLSAESNTIAHHLQFEARKTKWVYVVIRTTDKTKMTVHDVETSGTHKQFSIVASPDVYDKPILFDSHTPNDSSEPFERFYSKTLVPFHELPKRNLVLSREQFGETPSQIDVLLPNPTVRSIKREGETWIAERIVQL